MERKEGKINHRGLGLLETGLDTLANNFYELKVSPESVNNLSHLKGLLEENSSVLYFNHTMYGDGPIALWLALKYLNPSITRIGAPESMKSFDFKRNPLNATMVRIPEAFGVELSPVVQHYDRDSYSRELNYQLLSNFLRNSKEILGTPGGVLLFSPEGTRSQDGVLQEPQKGINTLGRIADPYYLPIAIIPEKPSNNGYNFGNRVEVNVGEPFKKDELDKDESLAGKHFPEQLMWKIAHLLPDDMRGRYQTP